MARRYPWAAMTTTARESSPAGRPADDHAAAGDSPFEPVAVPSRYEPPRASIDPDQTKGWIRRVLPVVMAHRRLLVGSLAAALIALLVSVAVPAVTRAAIDGAIIDGTRPLGVIGAELVHDSIGNV